MDEQTTSIVDDWTDNTSETPGQCANCDASTMNWCGICERDMCKDCIIDHSHGVDK